MKPCLVCRAETSNRCKECKDSFCSKECLTTYHRDKNNRSTCRTKQLGFLLESSRDTAPTRRLVVDPSAGALQFGTFTVPGMGSANGVDTWRQLSTHLPTMEQGTVVVYATEAGFCWKFAGTWVPYDIKIGLRNAADANPTWGTTKSEPVFVIIIERRDVSPASYYRVVVVPAQKHYVFFNAVCQTLFCIQPVGDVLLVIEPITHTAFQRLERMYVNEKEEEKMPAWDREQQWVEAVRDAVRRARKNRKRNQKRKTKRQRRKNKTQGGDVVGPSAEINEEEEDVCPLCLEVFGTESTVTLSCQHLFHMACWEVCVEVHKLQQRELLCPMCRAAL
jgi:hypothetical protein